MTYFIVGKPDCSLTHRLCGIVGIILMSLFPEQGQNLCWLRLDANRDKKTVVYVQGKTIHWLLPWLNGVALCWPRARFWHTSWLTTLVPATTLKLTQEGGGPVGLNKMSRAVNSWIMEHQEVVSGVPAPAGTSRTTSTGSYSPDQASVWKIFQVM